MVATTTPAGKMTANKTMPTATTKSGYTQKACNTIPRGPIRRGNGSTKSRTQLTKIEKGRSIAVEEKQTGTDREIIGCAWIIG